MQSGRAAVRRDSIATRRARRVDSSRRHGMISAARSRDSVWPEDRSGRSNVIVRARREGFEHRIRRPLYERLPHGPHRLDHEQVIRHQRSRIHGAMVEAVAAERLRGDERQAGGRPRGRLAAVVLRAVREQAGVLSGDLRPDRRPRREAHPPGVPRERRRPGGPHEGRLSRRSPRGSAANWKGARLVIVEAQTVGARRARAPAPRRRRPASGCSPRALPARRTRAPLPMPRSCGRSWAVCTRRCRGACARETRGQLPAPGRGDAALDAAVRTPARRADLRTRRSERGA